MGFGIRGRRLVLKNLSIYEVFGSMGIFGYGSEGFGDRVGGFFIMIT